MNDAPAYCMICDRPIATGPTCDLCDRGEIDCPECGSTHVCEDTRAGAEAEMRCLECDYGFDL